MEIYQFIDVDYFFRITYNYIVNLTRSQVNIHTEV